MSKHVLIVTEGPHDEAFIARVAKQRFGFTDLRRKSLVDPFWEKTIPTAFPSNDDLRSRMPVPSFYQSAETDTSLAIVFGGGEAKIGLQATDTLLMLPGVVDSLAIVIDADASAVPARFASVCGDLAAGGLRVPTAAGEVEAGPPRCGVFVLPDNANSGTLEDVLLDCAAVTFPGALTAVATLVAGVPTMGLSATQLKPFNKPAGPKKASVGGIGAVLRPGMSSQVTIANDEWICAETINLPKVDAFVRFLEQLV